MKYRFATLLASVALLLGAADLEAAAVTRNYKLTADLNYDLSEQLAAQPLLEIQNPRANTVAIRVTGVNIAYNPRTATTSVAAGVSKHASGANCSRVTTANAITLAPGEGITINGLESVLNCNVNSCGQPCTPTQGCSGSCVCILRLPDMRGTCIPFPPVAPDPDRITFEVTVLDDTVNGAPPAVRSTTFFTDLSGGFKAVTGGEVDMDTKQR